MFGDAVAKLLHDEEFAKAAVTLSDRKSFCSLQAASNGPFKPAAVLRARVPRAGALWEEFRP